MSSNYEILSMLAATFVVISFIPQAIKTIKTRHTSGISLTMYILYVSGLIFWVIYGLLESNLPLIIGNVATTLFALPILIIKFQEVLKKK